MIAEDSSLWGFHHLWIFPFDKVTDFKGKSYACSACFISLVQPILLLSWFSGVIGLKIVNHPLVEPAITGHEPCLYSWPLPLIPVCFRGAPISGQSRMNLVFCFLGCSLKTLKINLCRDNTHSLFRKLLSLVGANFYREQKISFCRYVKYSYHQRVYRFSISRRLIG
jgi:hypothetical protein